MLDQLPPEILICGIIPYLDWKDIYSLRKTCVYLYHYLQKNKDCRKKVLKVWQTSHPKKTWRYHYYGHKVYRIMRWRFHTPKCNSFQGCILSIFTKDMNDNDMMKYVLKDGMYNGLNRAPNFSCHTVKVLEKISGGVKYLIPNGGDVLINIIIKGGSSYKITYNGRLFKEGLCYGTSTTTIVWFNDFAGIPIAYLRFCNYYIKVYGKEDINLNLTFAIIPRSYITNWHDYILIDKYHNKIYYKGITDNIHAVFIKHAIEANNSFYKKFS